MKEVNIENGKVAIFICRRLNGILLDWEYPASEDRVFEAEKYEKRHPDHNSESVFVTKKLVVEGIQIEDSGSYICKVVVLKYMN